MKKLIIALGIIAAFVLIGRFVPLVNAEIRHTETYMAYEPYKVTEIYYEQEPYQAEEVYSHTRHVNEKVFDDGYTVIRGFDYPLSVHLEPAGAIVHGLIREHTGYGIDLYVFHELDYQAWRLGQPLVGAFVEVSNVTSEFFSFAPPVPGDYYFVLSNRDSSRDRLVSLEVYYYRLVTEQGTRTVTKYRTVEQQRTVTKFQQLEKERLVIRYERVPVFEYLLSRFQD